MRFADLKLVSEHPGPATTVRLYQTRVSDTESRYHFGFDAAIVKPIAKVLESVAGWGQKHWHADDGFWLYHTPIVGSPLSVPRDALGEHLKEMQRRYKAVANAVKSWGAKRGAEPRK